ncbi:carboxypeptidase-like regulatory domain-containing protein [Fibrobacterales bacterium]|nr:carboxypeptidase-like regulatory domain-containing protein [Fibrobacterales bacterium]
MNKYLIVAMVAMMTQSFAVTVKVSGRVISPNSKPIKSAEVTLGGAQFTALTDSNGVFLLSGEFGDIITPDIKPIDASDYSISIFSSRINIEIPVSSKLSLRVFDLEGRLVTTLLNDKFSRGVLELGNWNTGMASGAYVLSLQTETGVQSLKVYTTGTPAAFAMDSYYLPKKMSKPVVSAQSLALVIKATGYNNYNDSLTVFDADLGDITLDYSVQTLLLIDSVELLAKQLDLASVNPVLTSMLRNGDSLIETISQSYGGYVNNFYLNNGYNYIGQATQNIMLPPELDSSSTSYSKRLYSVLQKGESVAIDSTLTKVALRDLTYEEFIAGQYFVANTSVIPAAMDTLMNQHIDAIDGSYEDPSRSVFNTNIEAFVPQPIAPAPIVAAAKLSTKASNFLPIAKGLFSVAQFAWKAFGEGQSAEQLEKMSNDISYIKDMTNILNGKVDVIDQKLNSLATNMAVIDQKLNATLDKMTQNQSEILYLKDMDNRADLRSYRVTFGANNSQENAQLFWQPHYASIIKYINGSSIFNTDSIAKLATSVTNNNYQVNIPYVTTTYNCFNFYNAGMYCKDGVDGGGNITGSVNFTKSKYLLPMSFADLEYLAEIIMFQFNLTTSLYGENPAITPSKSITEYNREIAQAILVDLKPIKDKILSTYTAFANRSLYGATESPRSNLNYMASSFGYQYFDKKSANPHSATDYAKEIQFMQGFQNGAGLYYANAPYFSSSWGHYNVYNDNLKTAWAQIDSDTVTTFDPGYETQKQLIQFGRVANQHPNNYAAYQWQSNVNSGLAGLDEAKKIFEDHYKTQSSELFDFAIRLSAIELFLQSFINAEELVVNDI